MFVNCARNLPGRSCRELFPELFTELFPEVFPEVFPELFPELDESGIRGILTENPSIAQAGRLRDTVAHADKGRKPNLDTETKCD